MTWSNILAMVLGSLCVMGCNGIRREHLPPERTEAMARGAEEAAREELPVIVSIRGRHQEVVVQSGGRGPVYTVREAGTEVVRQATLGELQAARPELYRQIKGYWAGGDSLEGAWVAGE